MFTVAWTLNQNDGLLVERLSQSASVKALISNRSVQSMGTGELGLGSLRRTFSNSTPEQHTFALNTNSVLIADKWKREENVSSVPHLTRIEKLENAVLEPVDCDVKPIGFGQTIAESLSTSDCDNANRYYDDYSFSGLAGQKIAISAVSVYTGSSAIFGPRLELRDPAGALIDMREGPSGVLLSLSLPVDGNYRIRLTSSTESAVGTYRITLLETPTCSQANIDFGQSIDGNISSTDCYSGFRYFDEYKFNATVGRKVTARITSTDLRVSITLLNANGQSLAYASTSNTNLAEASVFFTIPAGGSYSLQVAPESLPDQPETGPYTIALIDSGICDPTPVSLSFTQILTGSLASADCHAKEFGSSNLPFYYDDLKFFGTAGQKINLRMNSPTVDAELQLFAPDGQRIAFGDAAGGGNSKIEKIISATGEYRVRATTSIAGQVGDYSLLLLNDAPCDAFPTPISIGQTIAASFAATGCSNGFRYGEYSLSGSPGQNISITVQSDSVPSYFELFDSSGQFVAASESLQGSTAPQTINFIFPFGGTFRLRLSAASANAAGTYSVAIAENGSRCTPPPLGMAAWLRGDSIAVTDATGNDARSIEGIVIRTMWGDVRANLTAGRVGRAFYLSGLNSYTSDSYFPTRPMGTRGPLSVTAWILPSSTVDNQSIVSKYDAVSAGVSFDFSLRGGRLYFEVNQSNEVSRSVVTKNDVVLPGSFQHVAATFDPLSQAIAIFVNGSSVPVNIINSGTVTSIRERSAKVSIGGLPGAVNSITQNFRGAIDEVQIYNRVLTAPEVGHVYGADNAGVCSFATASGKITTASGTPLSGVKVAASNGKEVTTDTSGRYKIFLQPNTAATLRPVLSTHSFTPSTHTLGLPTGDLTEKNFSAALSNDNFVGAAPLPGDSGEAEGITSSATREPSEPLHAGVVGANSVWFRWRAPQTAKYVFSLGGSQFDTLLAVYTGTSLPSLFLVAANDNQPGVGTFSQVTLSANAGEEYWIAVDGRAGPSGSGRFRMVYHRTEIIGIAVSGSVIARGNGDTIVPAAALTVTVKDQDGNLITTDITEGNGHYRVIIPSGIINFTVSAAGFGFVDLTNTGHDLTYDFIQPECACTVVFYAITGGFLGLPDSNDLKVTVSGPNLEPVSCALSLTSNTNFNCPGLLPYGTYTVTPTHPNFTFTPSSLTFISLLTNIQGALFTANESAGFTISGRVAQEGNPLSGVKVGISSGIGTFLETRTDSNGRYSIGPLPSGRPYSLYASLPGFTFQPSGPATFADLHSNQTINFSAASTCSYFIASPNQEYVPPQGGFYSFGITTSSPDCAWGPQTDSKTITLTTGMSNGAGSIYFYVEPNNGRAYTATITAGGQSYSLVVGARKLVFDFDGDGRADIAVRRPADNVWYFLRTTAGYTGFEYGVAGDVMTPADFDGDGKTDVAVFRPSEGNWYIAGSSTGFYVDSWGQTGDLPVPADFDGDGKADVAVYRPSNGTWYLKRSAAGIQVTEFGIEGDKPQIGDFDGDGKADLAVVRPAENTWYLLKSTNAFTGFTWGEPGDVNVPADYDGDGKTDPAVFRPSNGVWYIAGSSSGFTTKNWGAQGDVPVVSDYDGDGMADAAVFRPSNNTWYISASRDGIRVTQFGATSDAPVHGALIR
jgi:hypothetical protein